MKIFTALSGYDLGKKGRVGCFVARTSMAGRNSRGSTQVILPDGTKEFLDIHPNERRTLVIFDGLSVKKSFPENSSVCFSLVAGKERFFALLPRNSKMSVFLRRSDTSSLQRFSLGIDGLGNVSFSSL